MAELGETYNDDSVERTIFEGGVLPVGNYVGTITRADVVDTKSGDGKYLSLEIDIIYPEKYQSRKVWDKVNFINKNEGTQKEARAIIEDIRKACGLESFSDSDQIVDAVVQMEITVKRDKGGEHNGKVYEPKDVNSIRKYWHQNIDVEEAVAERKAAGKSGTAAAATPASKPAVAVKAAAPAATGAKVPAWKKNVQK